MLCVQLAPECFGDITTFGTEANAKANGIQSASSSSSSWSHLVGERRTRVFRVFCETLGVESSVTVMTLYLLSQCAHAHAGAHTDADADDDDSELTVHSNKFSAVMQSKSTAL